MLIAGLVTPITDYSCQKYIEKVGDKYNPGRTMRQAIVASCFIAPSIYVYSTKFVAKVLPRACGLTRLNKQHFWLFFSEFALFQPFLMLGIFFNLEFLRTGNVKDGIQNSITKAPIMLNFTPLYFTIVMSAKFRYIAPFYRPVFFTILNLPCALGVSFLNNINRGLNPTKLEKIEKYENFNKKYNLFADNLIKLRKERESMIENHSIIHQKNSLLPMPTVTI